MNHETSREETIFLAALEIPEAGPRAAFLLNECQDDLELLASVESLLRAHQEADRQFLREPVRPSSKCGLAILSGLEEALDRQKAAVADGGAGLPQERIGRYRLLKEIGEGGFGVVWEAEQEEPVRRLVALKIVKAGMDTREVIARFEAERQALAMMEHPNIARVFDGGATACGRPYFVMELVRGVRITEYCDRNRLTVAQRVALIIPVCQAVQHAHQKGVIHRDLKPSNILVTLENGVPVPKVIDFGIAKATEQRLTEKTVVTRFAQFLGSPAYMCPEQAAMSALDIDTRADVYSLGVLLYELLTGVLPFDTRRLLGAGLDELRRAIREQVPARPSARLATFGGRDMASVAAGRQTDGRKLIGLLHGDLDWIVMKCLEKDRRRRYETANGLAMDLRRHLDREPVSARPPSHTYRSMAFVRRHCAAVVSTAGFVGLLLIGTVLSLELARRANRERTRSEAARLEIQASHAEGVKRLLEAYLAQARANRWSGRPGQRFESLQAIANAAAIRPSIELRNEAIACLTLPDLRVGPRLRAFLPTSGVAVDPAYAHYAIGDEEGNLVVRRLSDHGETVRLPGPGVWAWSPEFSPDGRFLASCYHASGRDFPNAYQVWDLTRREIILTVSNCWRGQVFSPDNRFALFHRREEGPGLYDAETFALVRTLEVDPVTYPYSAFSRDGRLLAIPSLADGDVRIVDVSAGRVIRRLAHPGAVRAVDWHPDGRHLAAPCSDGRTYLWETETGRLLEAIDDHAQPGSIASFSSRGDLLLTSGWDSTFSLWDVDRRKRLMAMSAVRPFPRFSPDDRWAGLLVVDKQFALLEVSTAPEYRPLRRWLGQEQRPFECAVMDGQGRLLAAGGADGVRLWDLASGRELACLQTNRVDSMVFLHGQKQLATCGDAGVLLWPIASTDPDGRKLRVGPPQVLASGGVWRGLSADAAERMLAVSQDSMLESTNPDQVCIFDLTTNAPPMRLPAYPNQALAVLSPDGHWLATGCWRGREVRIWDTTTGREVRALPIADSAVFPRFSPDGTRLVAGTPQELYCWEVGTWRTVYRVAHDLTPTSQPSRAVFSPDGRVIALYHRYNRTHLIEAREGRLLATLDLDRHESLAFSPDGAFLVMGAGDGQLNVLDLRRIRQELAEMNLDWEMPPFPPPARNLWTNPPVVTVMTEDAQVAEAKPGGQ